MKIPIFYYHSVGGDSPETLPLEVFIKHLETLIMMDFKTLTMSALLKNNFNPEENNAVITFDDGFMDNYELALPELLKRNMVATFFVVPGYNNITRWLDPKKRRYSEVEKDGHTIPQKCMNSDQIKELSEKGMEIGCHSFTHRKLTEIERGELKREIIDSKKVLEDKIGNPVETFCYPKGGHNQEIVNLVEEAGYLGATITWPGYYQPRKSPYKCNRFLIENPYYFKEILKGKAFSPISLLRAFYIIKG